MTEKKRPKNAHNGEPEATVSRQDGQIDETMPEGRSIPGSDAELSAEPQPDIPLEELKTARVPYAGLLKRKVYSGMWGPYEVAAVGFAALLLLATVLFYLFFVMPANRELAAGRQQRDSLEMELQSARQKWGGVQDTETQVAKLLTSAEDFEIRFLKDESVGRTSIYQRLNVLINAYRLRNTSGPDYVPLDINEEGTTNREGDSRKRGRDKLKSIFPGIYITTTVEGPYSAIRGFIRDIENSTEFMAITAIQLEPSDEEGAKAETETVEVSDQAGRKTAQRFRKGRYRGNVVSLRIEMAAYFRRPPELRLNTSLVEQIEDKDGAS